MNTEHKHDARIAGLQAAIDETSRQLQELEDEWQRLRNERAADLCEFKRGDRITDGRKEYFISRVIAEKYESRTPQIFGWNVLKNGQAGNRESKIYGFNGIKRVEK